MAENYFIQTLRLIYNTFIFLELFLLTRRYFFKQLLQNKFVYAHISIRVASNAFTHTYRYTYGI